MRDYKNIKLEKESNLSEIIKDAICALCFVCACYLIVLGLFLFG